MCVGAGGDASDLEAWLALTRCPGLGPVSVAALLARYGNVAKICAGSTSGWRAAGVSAAGIAWLRAPDADLLAADKAWLEVPGHHLIVRGDARYPVALAESPDAPPWLFGVGDADLLAAPGLAIVGSRNPSRDGLAHAGAFAAAVARAGLAVVSGLASGIDAAAHAGALDANGMTIAVCGTGLNRVYPAANAGLAERIGAQGLLLSEFALDTPARRGHFPRRNRIIAALALGTLVVEAARNSGSLITARYAMEYGRSVFALPGSVHNPLARGCHRLIRDGAKLVEDAGDIFEDIAPQLPRAAAPAQARAGSDATAGLDADHERLLACLGHDPARVDELVERSGLTADAVSSMLLILELQGMVAPAPGGAFTRAGRR